MSQIILSMIIVAMSTGSWSRPCACQKALEDDLPHGANEDIEYREKTVKKIQGQVLYRDDDEAVDDVVVEIYDINETDKNLTPSDIALRRERQAACVTPKDGSFCFPDLPSGRYILRAGTRSSSAGMNEAYMKVTVDRRWWSKWFRAGKRIKLELTPGT
jgi:hypothetical protein